MMYCFKLLADKRSPGKGRGLYGKAGDKVRIISDRTECYIVENEKKNRFSVVKNENIQI